MSRRKSAPKRIVLPDPILGSRSITKFINTVMRDGKRACAERIVYGALNHVVISMAQNQAGLKHDAAPIKEREAAVANKKKPAAKKNAKESDSFNIYDSASARDMANEVFDKVLSAVRPTVEVRSRRVGGANYQIPVEVKHGRSSALGMRWLVGCSSKRSEKSMAMRLAYEILDILQGRGATLKKRDEVHKMAKANQAFAHFRW